MELIPGNERTATVAGRTRTAFTVAALVVLSAFATDNATPASAEASPVTVAHDVTPAEIVTTVSVPRKTVFTRIKSGLASWYGDIVLQGRQTASGRIFDKNELTAAHHTLPFGSKVKVTDLRNQRSVIVTITDRGLFPNRVIDLSLGAARELRMVSKGVDPVRLELLTFQN
jgi:rare lipoprotein A